MMRKIIALVLFAVIIVLLIQRPSAAQIDGGPCVISQEGVEVGAIFVPERNPDARRYNEYWYLFSNYSYPGASNPIVTEIRCGGPKFTNQRQFKKQMKTEHPDGYLIEVASHEKRSGPRASGNGHSN
ncbi:MAG: hypothetical protein AAF215_28060 [Cyanobacteria bacterium P01_A01_bin.123]